MTYHYGNYWAQILPVRSTVNGAIRYWHYKIFDKSTNTFLFDGHDADLPSARATTEAHIDNLIKEERHPIAA